MHIVHMFEYMYMCIGCEFSILISLHMIFALKHKTAKRAASLLNGVALKQRTSIYACGSDVMTSLTREKDFLSVNELTFSLSLGSRCFCLFFYIFKIEKK